MVDARMRPLVDIAAEVMSDETQRIEISYTGFCLTALPHKRLSDDQPWEKKGHRVTLLVEPGRLKHGGKIKLFGVPYGARARMILLYLQTQAIRTRTLCTVITTLWLCPDRHVRACAVPFAW